MSKPRRVVREFWSLDDDPDAAYAEPRRAGLRRCLKSTGTDLLLTMDALQRIEPTVELQRLARGNPLRHTPPARNLTRRTRKRERERERKRPSLR